MTITVGYAYYSQYEPGAGCFVYIISFNPLDNLMKRVWWPLFSDEELLREVMYPGSHSSSMMDRYQKDIAHLTDCYRFKQDTEYSSFIQLVLPAMVLELLGRLKCYCLEQ